MLSSHDRMYGYQITQEVRLISNDEIIVTEGSLYPILHKMEEEGLVMAEKVNIGNRTRRYYSLTPAGVSRLSERLNEFEHFVQVMRRVLFPSATTE